MLATLLTDLRGAGERSAATRVLLAALARRVGEAFSAARLPANVRGASFHLRPGGAYTDLTTLTPGTGVEASESSTAWAIVTARAAAHVLDVEAGRIGELSSAFHPDRAASVSWAGATRVQLRGRSTTHLVILPIHGVDGSGREALQGMVLVEVDCATAVGRRIDALAPVAAELQLMVDAGVPIALSLPRMAPPSAAADPLLPVVGRAMAGVVETLRAFSAFEDTLLLRGATGTGKSHLASWCHAHSARADGPFVVAQLHSVTETLREGDLFGWRKGAFTGANTDHRGRVSQAEGGTLFIDEIDKLDLAAQGKLLRLLEERRFRVIGEERERVADTRFIVGTNANLEREVADGRFLEDLYYRVNVLPVEVPALRERVDEIGAWARHMAANVRGRSGPAPQITPEAAGVLASQPWPGNLRQLQSVVVRAVALASIGIQGPVTVGAEPVLRALGMEGRRGSDGGVVGGLREAALAFLRENGRRAARGDPPLDLELVTALRGALLVEAVRSAGGAREAFVELGLESRLQGGNHLRTLRREHERLVELCAAVGVPLPPEWVLADDLR